MTARIFASAGIRIVFPRPAKAAESRPLWGAASTRPTGAGTGTMPSRGRVARTGASCIPAQAPTDPSAQAGTSCRRTRSGFPAVINRTISRRWLRTPGRAALPRLRFQVRASTGLYCRARARRNRRSAGLHALVRPRARHRAGEPRTRPRGRGRGRGRDLPLPLRRAPPCLRLPSQRALLSPLLAAWRTLAATPAAQGRRAPRRRGVAVAPARRRAPRAVARRPPDRRRAPLPQPLGLHRP